MHRVPSGIQKRPRYPGHLTDGSSVAQLVALRARGLPQVGDVERLVDGASYLGVGPDSDDEVDVVRPTRGEESLRAPAPSARAMTSRATSSQSSPQWCPLATNARSGPMAASKTSAWSLTMLDSPLPARSLAASVSPVRSEKTIANETRSPSYRSGRSSPSSRSGRQPNTSKSRITGSLGCWSTFSRTLAPSARASARPKGCVLLTQASNFTSAEVHENSGMGVYKFDLSRRVGATILKDLFFMLH